MLSLEEALAHIVNDLCALPGESAELLGALGRVLSEPVLARRSLPAFANSAMDGYAVRAADTAGASPQNSVSLPISQTISAGSAPTYKLLPHTAARIFTGAPMPLGADAVVIQENTTRQGDTVYIQAAAKPEQNVRHAGEDINATEPLAKAGDLLTAGTVSVLAAQGQLLVPVHRRPRVAIVPTGDELVELDQPLQPGQVPNSNSLMLAAQVLQSGGIPIRMPIAPDNRQSLENTMRSAAASADLVLTCGGVSVGDYDLVRQVLESLGQVQFWKVAIKPGKPLAYGRMGPCPIIGLPGNPVSAFVTFELFAKPAIHALLGQLPEAHYTQARISEELKPDTSRREFVRARTQVKNNELWVIPYHRRGSGMQSSLLGVNALIDVPPGEALVLAGSMAQVRLL